MSKEPRDSTERPDPKGGLKKDLGLGAVLCISAGAMISSGLFILPGIAHAQAGPASVFSYFFAGLVACCGMLSVAEMITAMPKTGGDYFIVTRTLGPAVGTVTGLLVWFSLALKTSFALLGLSVFAGQVMPWHQELGGVGLCLIFLLLNIVGVRQAAFLQYGVVIGAVLLIVLYCGVGVQHVHSDHLLPFAPLGWHAVFATSGLIFVSYGGLLKTTAVAEEVRDPGRNLPLGMILSLVVVVLLYTVAVFVTSGVLPGDELNMSLTPISDGADAIMGQTGRLVLSVAAFFAFVSTANAGLMASSRYLLALSRDHLAPEILGRVNTRFSTPHIALLFTALVIIGSLFLETKALAGAASTVLIVSYILANLSVIILRESGLLHYRPVFRAPLYPVLQVLGILGSVFMLSEMGMKALVLSLILVFAGLFFYWFYGRIRSNQEYALKRMISRITHEEQFGEELERELQNIVRERGGIAVDRFDELVENALFFDLNEKMEVSGISTKVADALAGKWGIAPLEAAARVSEHLARNTLDEVVPRIAVGEVDIDCQGVYDLVIIRDRQYLESERGKFHALFLIVTCKGEERRFVETVAALSQILLPAEFEKEFLEAKDERRVKDLLLLGTRRRGWL
ncbi:APC family permease [Desulfohalovibrio reitneri]|uniref:APC family permease n=1 Tax=Desulfohalovibrio reitneri TaxID=1307759 RepID=UPI00068C1CB4|nr:APC family permease [Desulfohalovibrio reitneri]